MPKIKPEVSIKNLTIRDGGHIHMKDLLSPEERATPQHNYDEVQLGHTNIGALVNHHGDSVCRTRAVTVLGMTIEPGGQTKGLERHLKVGNIDIVTIRVRVVTDPRPGAVKAARKKFLAAQPTGEYMTMPRVKPVPRRKR